MTRKRVTQDEIVTMNELYLEKGTYAAVAREVGFSPSTVKKYIISNYVSTKDIERQVLSAQKIKEIENFVMTPEMLENSRILIPTEEEMEDIAKIWESIVI